MNKELKTIRTTIIALQHGQGYDARKKAYKDGEKEIEKLVNEGKKIVVAQAVKKVSTLGFDFKPINTKYNGPLGQYTKGDFTVYIKPYFSEYSSRDGEREDFGLYLGLGNYARSIIHSEDKDFKTKLGQVISKKRKEHLAAKRVQAKNNDNANTLYLLLKNVLSYKSYSSIFERDKTPWAGDKIQVEYIDKLDSWHSKAMLEYEFRDKHFEVDARVNFVLLTANDCYQFWAEFDALVKKYTDFIRKKENE